MLLVFKLLDGVNKLRFKLSREMVTYYYDIVNLAIKLLFKQFAEYFSHERPKCCNMATKI